MLRRGLVAAILVVVLTGCVIVPERQHALVLEPGGTVAQRPMRCGDPPGPPSAGARTLDPGAIRLASWNLHKEADPGWDGDLARLAEQSDMLLIQEAEVSPQLRAVMERSRFSWLLSSAFEYLGLEYGVLTATRVAPASACTLRANEPLLNIPKAALITHYRLLGRDATLAVANLHAINFALGTDAYRAQLDAIGDELANHRGPIVVAGDFNTWNGQRDEVVRAFASRLSLTPVVFAVDQRKRFMGRIFDWIYVREVEIVGATAWAVSSSDHNPLVVSFRVR
ncbi:MAG TPA: endonuclease/exonuclease/phosphatase family protein [Actinomycetota bacterium]|nr:endonuclease/exonuclease/phosphatase family protein [Actinomycetota bacterium]